jgi:putative inorganic carbon (hco3(-)) transporter
MRDLYIALVYLSFLVMGVTAPFVCVVGYAWVDAFYPQLVSGLVAMLPASLVMAVAALGLYMLTDRRSPPAVTAHMVLTLALAVWVTITLNWAEVPDLAWAKWNWAFKTVIFSAFLPFALRTRVQIEAFLQVFLLAAAFHMMPVAVKTFLSGSAYGRGLGVVSNEIGLAESSMLAAASSALIPVMLYFRKHSVLIPKSPLRNLGYLGMIPVAVMAAIGTYARTALVGFAVVGAFVWWQSRRKILTGACIGVLALGFSFVASKSWEERISTTTDYNEESSALGRILVWQWTLGYVATHPLGGGFDAYRISRIEVPTENGQPPFIAMGKAYHNMYIEVLGDHGFPGLIIFASIQLIALNYLRSVIRRTRGKEYLAWLHDLARTLLVSLLTMMACGCFIGIAFQPIVWYLMTLPLCLHQYLRRVEALEKPRVPLPFEQGFAAAGGAGGRAPGRAPGRTLAPVPIRPLMR